MQLPIEEFVGADASELLRHRGVHPPRDAIEQIDVARAENDDVGLARLRGGGVRPAEEREHRRGEGRGR